MPHGKKRATKDTLKILKSDGKAVLKKPSRKKVQEQWSLGTAFSGMEAVTFALRQIGMEGKYAHRFTIEKDQACNSFICQNCDVDEMHTDITAVKLEELQPVDVFVAGFPCQPFSLAGLREGSEDSKGRGKMFDYCLNYIAMHLPKAFILENVAALRLDKRFAGMWTYITEALEKLENYVISEKVMDTRESGLPHARRRIYIVGLRNDTKTDNFSMPKPVKTVLDLDQLLDTDRDSSTCLPTSKTHLRNLVKVLEDVLACDVDVNAHEILADINCGPNRKPHWSLDECPCVTRARGGSGGYWIVNRSRFMSYRELLRLQGIPPSDVKREGLSDRQIGQMVGNSMSANVLARLMCRVLVAIGVAKRISDPWQ